MNIVECIHIKSFHMFLSCERTFILFQKNSTEHKYMAKNGIGYK